MRNFSKTLTLMGLLTPVGANALGVGEIELHSALNQVLEAEIPVITSNAESTSDIQVKLASPSAFANAGIDRPYYLSWLHFTPVIKDGRIVVKVTSKGVIQEPFLNFLIEVNWPKGRMLREFTVLLDPPATFDESAISATRAPKVQSSTVAKPTYSVDQPSNFGIRAKPSAAPESESPDQYQSGDSITSKPNDSLWNLAKKVSTQPPVSQEQMMVALYNANPNAFFRKNMNALKAGQRLTVPPRNDIVKISRNEALVELGRQNGQWNASIAAAAQTKKPSPENPAIAADQNSSAQGRKLQLVSPVAGETIAKSASAESGNARAGKSDLAIEMAETVHQENEELRSRLKEIEAQLARIQLMLTLKDKQLSALQSRNEASGTSAEKIIDLQSNQSLTENQNTENRLAGPAENSIPMVGISAGEADTPIPVVAENSPETTSNLNQPDSGNDPAVLKQESDPVANTPVADSNATAELVPPDPTTATNTIPPAETKAVPAVLPQTPATPEPARLDAPPEDELLSGLFSDSSTFAAGSGALVLFGFFCWALVRRRNRIMLASTESVPSSPDNEIKKLNEVTSPKIEQPNQNELVSVVESSFLSEFTPSDFDALETDHDDVDPVSEADVYLAYGRYQQAEDLIRSAIENYPEREECKLKLLEIHFATEDRDAFEAYARALEQCRNDKPEFWAKVAEMGREICPNSSLFAPNLAGAHTEPEDNFARSDFSNRDSETFEYGGREIQSGESDFAGDNLGFDFAYDLGEDDSSESGSGPTMYGEPDPTAFNPFEFDASELNHFNVDGGAQFSADFDARESNDARYDNESEKSHETMDFSSLDFGDSAGTPGQTAPDVVSELSYLTDMDEIETKLDLAKAYVDMDDQESARGILSEILVKGNDDQKHEAQTLVDVLEQKA